MPRPRKSLDDVLSVQRRVSNVPWDAQSPREKAERVRGARDKIARRIARGEHWLLPAFKQLNDELAALEEEENLLAEALRLAGSQPA